MIMKGLVLPAVLNPSSDHGKRDSGATLAALTLAAEAADRYPPMVTGGSRSSVAITWPSSAASSRHC